MESISVTKGSIGTWNGKGRLITEPQKLKEALLMLDKYVSVVNKNGATGIVVDGCSTINTEESDNEGNELYAWASPLPPESLGDIEFKKEHRLKYAYIMGAMANGITSAEIVISAAANGMLGFFGAGGLSLDKISEAIDKIQANVGNKSYGFNLIHSPATPEHEKATVDLYLKKGVKLVSAAAYLRLTKDIVYYRIKGLSQNTDGSINIQNKIIAKISRVEVAKQFLSPPPEKIVSQLLKDGLITENEALLSKNIPMADDISAEADSGGHTDNRPALSLLPTMIALRNQMMKQYNYKKKIRVGLGGGIATPESAAGAFAMGAAYILVGSVNQACTEAGTSDLVKNMLANAQQADVVMTPAADMFEMGVKVQVLKRGTMFSMKASKLYDLYSNYDSIESLPPKIKKELEDKYFKTTIEKEWESTASFFRTRDPEQLKKAANDPKHKMALIFRSYLGRASMWAVKGIQERAIDYQVWCGPSMGAFNEWVKGSFLEKTNERKVATIALNILKGAAFISRINMLRSQGVVFDNKITEFSPERI